MVVQEQGSMKINETKTEILKTGYMNESLLSFSGICSETPNNFKSFKWNLALNEAKRRKTYYELMCFLFVWNRYMRLFIYPFFTIAV